MADAQIRQIGPEWCARCGKPKVVPILYGLLTVAAYERVKRGEAVVGGCWVGRDDPVAQCKACGWKRKRKEPRWPDTPDGLPPR